MNDQTIIYLLAALGWAGVIWTQIRRRTTPLNVWIKENIGGIVAGFIGTATLMLIGPGDGVDLGTYMAKTWAAGLGAASAYLIGGNVPSTMASERRAAARKAGE